MASTDQTADPPTAAAATGAAAPARTRRASAALRHLGLVPVLALSGVLEFNKLSQNGYSNLFYAAAVKSDLLSLHNFFFVSFDQGGLDSIDKPPLAIWLQTLSAKLFGFAPLSLIVPEGICALAAVALLYFIVARRLGVIAALLSALALAVFPSFVAVSRENAVDPLLILFMVGACGAGIKAIESGRTRWLLLSALLIGLAFNTKSLAALLCVPGIGLGYLLCAPTPWRRRAWQLVAGAVVMAAVAASWSLAVDLTPASQRPYVGGSTNNSELQLEFGYNGFGRTGGQVGGPPCPEVASPPISDVPVFRPPAPAGANSASSDTAPASGTTGTTGATGNPGVTVRNPNPVPFASCNLGPLRIFGLGLGDQAGWTVPLGIVGLLALAFVLVRLPRRLAGSARRTWWRRGTQSGGGQRDVAAAQTTDTAPVERAGGLRDRQVALLFAFGGWFLLELGFLDYSKGIIHPYYSSALGPGLAVMIGAAAVAITQLVQSPRLQRVAVGLGVAAVATLATVGAELYEIHNHGYPDFWRYPLIVAAIAALVAVALLRRRAQWPVAALVVVLLVAQGVYSSSVWDAPVDGTFPTAGPYNEAGWGGISLPGDELAANRALAAYVTSHHPTHDFEVLTQASDGASPLILLGLRAAAMGGYNTTDPALTGDGLAGLVARHAARYVVVGGPYFQRGGNRASAAARLVCPQVPQSVWYPADPVQGTIHLVDCAGRAADLRHPYRVALAYLRTHWRIVYPVQGVYEDNSGFRSTVHAEIAGKRGTVTVKIGPTSACTKTVYARRPFTGARKPPGGARTLRFALPANWYFQIKLRGKLVLATTYETFR